MVTKAEVDLTLRIYALKGDLEDFNSRVNELISLCEKMLIDNAQLRDELKQRRRA